MPSLTVSAPPKQLTHLAPLRFEHCGDHVVVADEGAHIWVLPADGLDRLLADELPTPKWSNSTMPAWQLFAADHDALWTAHGLRARLPGLGLGPCRLVIDASAGIPLQPARAAISLWMCSGHRQGILQVEGADPSRLEDLLFLASFVKEKNRYENKALQLHLLLGAPDWSSDHLTELRRAGWSAFVRWSPGVDTAALHAQLTTMGSTLRHMELHLDADGLPASLRTALPSWGLTSWSAHWHAMPTPHVQRSTLDAVAEATGVPFHLCHQVQHPDQPALHHLAIQPCQTLALDARGDLWPSDACLTLPDALRAPLALGPAHALTYEELVRHEALRALFLAALPEGREGLRHDWKALFHTPDPAASLAATGQMVCSPAADSTASAALAAVGHALDIVRSHR